MTKPKYGKAAGPRGRPDSGAISRSATAYQAKRKAEFEAQRAQEATSRVIPSPDIATYQPAAAPYQRPVYDAPGCVIREYFSGNVL